MILQMLIIQSEIAIRNSASMEINIIRLTLVCKLTNGEFMSSLDIDLPSQGLMVEASIDFILETLKGAKDLPKGHPKLFIKFH